MMTRLQDRPTLGLEEELFAVHRDTGALASIPEQCREELRRRLGTRYQAEYKACVLELVTRLIHHDPHQLIDEAAANRCEANAILARFDLTTLAIACHPTAVARDQPARDDDRYRRIEESKGNAVRELLVNGVHVHVGTYESAERLEAIPVLMHLAPLHAALTACSPRFDGRDTGQASWRLRVLMRLASSLPVYAATEDELGKFNHALRAAGGPADEADQWGLVRLGAGKPTIELRAADTAPELDMLVGLVALTASAAFATRKRWLGMPPFSPMIASSVYLANFDAVAARGAETKLIDPYDLEPKSVPDYVNAWVHRCGNAIDALDFGSTITEFTRLVAYGDPAQCMRALMAQAEANGRACGLLPFDAQELAARHAIKWAWERANASPAKPWTSRMRIAA